MTPAELTTDQLIAILILLSFALILWGLFELADDWNDEHH